MASAVRAFRDGILVELAPAAFQGSGGSRLVRSLADLSRHRRSRRWYLDCSGVECLSSRVLAQLLLLDCKLRARSGRLCLINLGPRVYALLHALRLTSLLDVSRQPDEEPGT
jgi:anti-anti-sigma regulatory factor